MTYLDDPDLDALLAEIDGMSDEELDQLAAEMEAGDAGWPGDDDYDLEGPWRDLANATAQMDAMYQRNAQRLAGRAAGGTGRLKDEDRLASAMQAIGQGTYTEPPQLRTGPEAVRDRLGLAQDACGRSMISAAAAPATTTVTATSSSKAPRPLRTPRRPRPGGTCWPGTRHPPMPSARRRPSAWPRQPGRTH